jgi:hypothetical protein
MEEAAPRSWVALLTLMVEGPAVESTLRGVIRSFDGTDEQRHHFGWTAAAGDPRPVLAGAHPGDDPDDPGESFLRVWCDGPRLRTEGLDGQVFVIGGTDICWQFDLEDERPLASPRRALRYWAGGTQLLERRAAADFLGDDFTRPTGPVTATTFLGRAAWAVELAPPKHKPYPIQLVIDAETGRVLQQRNDGFGSVDEWVELAVGERADRPAPLRMGRPGARLPRRAT